ncbi:MAG: sensor histidine kinase, partial [Pseudoclavibacter sp.]
MAYRAIRWNELSLRNKLTLVIVALLTFGIVVAGIGTTLMLRPTLVAQLDSQLSAVAADPVSVIGGDPTTQRFTYDNVRQAPQPYYVAIVDDS